MLAIFWNYSSTHGTFVTKMHRFFHIKFKKCLRNFQYFLNIVKCLSRKKIHMPIYKNLENIIICISYWLWSLHRQCHDILASKFCVNGTIMRQFVLMNCLSKKCKIWYLIIIYTIFLFYNFHYINNNKKCLNNGSGYECTDIYRILS